MEGLKKYIFCIVIGISVVVFVVWLSFYFCKFHGELSPKQSDWGDFSNYVSAVTGLISLFILSFLTYLIHKESAALKIKLERPVLTFSFDGKTGHYYCTNIGKGSAMNVIIIHKLKEGQNHYDLAVQCFSIPMNKKVDITWIKGTFEFITLYDDISKLQHMGKFVHGRLEELRFDATFDKEWKVDKVLGQKVSETIPLYDAINRTA
ncbi:MAG: hypothetical protein FVQ77_10660 [Cytophagales bacterium]|nr:hypothetical protein [Cytophagales bacterium]